MPAGIAAVSFFDVFEETALLFGQQHELPAARRVLVFAPHPDDEVFGCGGATALLAEKGALVHSVILTDGAAGAGSNAASVQARREEESCRAAEVLGCATPEFWRFPDRGLQPRPLVERIAGAIEAFAPELLFLPSPVEIHPDHQAVALSGLAALRLLDHPCQVFFYEISHPLITVTHVVCIDRVLEKKTSAMECFTSQLAQLPYHERIMGLNCYRAYHLGQQARAAEAFAAADSRDIEALRSVFLPTVRQRRLLIENRRLLKARAADADKLAMFQTQIAVLEETIEHLRHELLALKESRSWQLTAPLRAITNLGRSLLAKRPRA